MKSNPPTF